jgi:hypothetical protein
MIRYASKYISEIFAIDFVFADGSSKRMQGRYQTVMDCYIPAGHRQANRQCLAGFLFTRGLGNMPQPARHKGLEQ